MRDIKIDTYRFSTGDIWLLYNGKYIYITDGGDPARTDRFMIEYIEGSPYNIMEANNIMENIDKFVVNGQQYSIAFDCKFVKSSTISDMNNMTVAYLGRLKPDVEEELKKKL